MSTDSPSTAETVAALLSRGGVCLGLAAVSLARGASSSDIRFHALDPGLSRATTNILRHLEKTRDFTAISTALDLAMNPAPASRAPGWSQPFSADPALIETVGIRLNPAWPPHSDSHCDSARTAGLACLAIAMCRSIDSAEAFAGTLPEEDARILRPMVFLAAVTARPGEPGQMKNRIENILQQLSQELSAYGTCDCTE